MGSSNSTSGDIHEGNEITIWRNYLYCHVLCSLICYNNQGQEDNLSVHRQKKDKENYTYVMEYHSAFKKKEILIHAITRKKHKDILLLEGEQNGELLDGVSD